MCVLKCVGRHNASRRLSEKTNGPPVKRDAWVQRGLCDEPTGHDDIVGIGEHKSRARCHSSPDVDVAAGPVRADPSTTRTGSRRLHTLGTSSVASPSWLQRRVQGSRWKATSDTYQRESVGPPG
jgi:hypothetical protein